MAAANNLMQFVLKRLGGARHFSSPPLLPQHRAAKLQQDLQDGLRNVQQRFLCTTVKEMHGKELLDAVEPSHEALSPVSSANDIWARLKGTGFLMKPTHDSASLLARPLSKSFHSIVQSILDEDELNSHKKTRDCVHISMVKNKTFVTVTDSKGNRKTGASAGCLEDRKGRARLSKYAAEATAEHVGRSARKMGVKSVVMKVKGFAFFRKKSKVILSWREGFRGENVGEQSPVMYIHDVTQLPHNGCRLPKRRRT